ncbi:hypothetical protein BUALT_Bualt03G0196200 [Buddleja alternifolia]|uniref:DAGKc domain-containing protein n=1 Tax=Buddleja alternifolia TaxID=168488 RepID=A0AAV6XXB9_9LAMI|nr:hypothetical protein BUALT_Bualt03G0196200 [Buddleja alternifolia]
MILCRAVAVMAMAKPSFIRAEQPYAPNLVADRTTVRGGATSRRRDMVFVVNPRGANGRTGKEWKKLFPYLRSRLGSDCNVSKHFIAVLVGLEVQLFGMLFAFWFGAGETHFEEVKKEESCENESVGGYNNGLLSEAKRSSDGLVIAMNLNLNIASVLL